MPTTTPSRRSRARFLDATSVVALAAVAVLAALACHACSSFSATPDDTADGGGGDAARGPSSSADGGVAVVVRAASCRELLAADPSLHGKNGIYSVTPDDASAIHVYCDMTLDDGGWTLAGRSSTAAAPGTPFGWSSSTGDVTDTTVPYSLDVVASHIAFTEVLLATQDGARAFRLAVTKGFLANETATVATGTVATVRGDCSPNGGPQMLRNTGATKLTDTFFFRDIPDTGQHRGLNAGGFSLAYADCEHGASLDGLPGTVSIR